MTRAWLTSLVAALALGCPRAPASPADAGPPPQGLEVVASVNGRQLTQLELELRLRAGTGHGEAQGKPAREAALEALITQELEAQRAVELGLDRDPGYQAAAAQLEAQKRELERRQLAQLFEEKEIRQKAQVTEAQARAYFEQHRARLSQRVSVSQLLVKGREALEPLKRRLDAGEAFDAVAASLYPVEPEGKKPWQLGPLTWQQVPEAWWPALDAMKVGELSPIIDGPGGRAWLLRLDARSDDPSLTFEAARPGIEAVLKNDVLTEKRDAALQELKAKAQILRRGSP